MKKLLLNAVFLNLIISYSSGIYISSSQITKGKFYSFIYENFGMASGGSIKVELTVTPSNFSREFASNILLLGIDEDQRKQWFHKFDNIQNLCESPSWMRILVTGSKTVISSYTVSSLNKYSILLMQCWDDTVNNPAILNLNMQLTNPTPSNEIAHLSIEEVMFVRVYMVEIFLYSILVITVYVQLYISKYVPFIYKFLFIYK